MALAKLRDGRIVEIVQSQIEACPRGGGFLMRIPVEDIAEINVRPEPHYELMMVAIEDGPAFQAWVDPADRWNGWLQPAFEMEEAVRLVEWEEAEMGMHCRYDRPNDRFILAPRAREGDPPELIEEHTEIAKGFDLMTSSGLLRLYPIGAGSWIWGEADDAA